MKLKLLTLALLLGLIVVAPTRPMREPDEELVQVLREINRSLQGIEEELHGLRRECGR